MDCATYMCEEIVIQILARLPAKSLVRFMVVCRLWKSIITSPQFQLVSNRPTKLLAHTDRECYTLVEDDQEENRRLVFETEFPLKPYSYDRAEVIGSDNGLICIGIIQFNGKKRGIRGDCFFRVMIWNPCIRKHVVMPNNPNHDNITCSNVYASGFGGTISGGDYKFVSVVELRSGGGWGRNCTAVDIYSLKADTWWRRKYLDWDFAPGIVCQSYTCALLRGRLHWMGERRNEILSFELEDEVFENKFMVPETFRSQEICFYVTVIRESLAVITTHEFGRKSTVCVMGEYGDVHSWIFLFNIDLDVEILERRVDRNMVHWLKNGHVFLCLRCTKYHSAQKLVTYNPYTMKTYYCGGGSSTALSKVHGFTNDYKESLVLLGDHRAVGDQQNLQDCLQGLYPVWTTGDEPGYNWYPFFQDQNGFYHAWTGNKWIPIKNNYPFVTIQ